MCGILGYVGRQNAANVLLDGLRRLEYRGYDSSGVAVVTNDALELRRAVGKLAKLEDLLRESPVEGTIGLGHTRWATHGAPSKENAHPHTDRSGRIVVVHNGIIENYQELKEKLKKEGYEFKSDTDTEVIAYLIGSKFEKPENGNPEKYKNDFIQAVRESLKEIKGTFALGIIHSKIPNFLVGARRDCPLIVGLGKDENFLASDAPAILSHTRDVVFLEDGDMVVIQNTGVQTFSEAGDKVERASTRIMWDPIQAEKSGYKHFMLKEIFEQPRVVEDTLLGRMHSETKEVSLPEANIPQDVAKKISQIRFVACGTSWHAALVGSFLIEKYTRIPCQVDIASEFRYRDPVLDPNTLVVSVSQSGETADTLAAIRLAKKRGIRTLGIANVVGSSLTRETDGTILTHCGPEIGVASTKAYMGQLVAMHLLTLYLALQRKALPEDKIHEHAQGLTHLSQWITKTLECRDQVKKVAKACAEATSFLYLGRNINYPNALEGALKLKEISYIHAEGYPAGEMKHGPIALIDQNLPIVAIATASQVYEKMVSNIEEARSRGARVIAIANEGDRIVGEKASHVIYVPKVPEDFSPMVNVVPLQMLAYEIALNRGCDVDQPRNLAKSATVE